MKYNELVSEPFKKRNRVGRGIAHGQGKTAGRGTKGQGARTGSSAKPGFEGGQNPFLQKIPKLRGFKPFWAETDEVKISMLDELNLKVIDNQSLADAGLIPNAYTRVKLIGAGALKSKLDVRLQFATAGAVASVNAAGGSFTKVARVMRPKTSTKEARTPRAKKPKTTK
jgi:large subunit ribosomal protein L15